MNAMHYLPRLDLEPLTQLLRHWRGDHPGMGLLALLPEAEKAGVKGLQRACRDLDIPLVGAIFPALIEAGVFRAAGLWLLRFDQMPYAALHPDLPRDSEALGEAAEALVADLKVHLTADPDTTLCLLFDSMVPNIGSVIDEIYLRLANRVRYMGANAGSETFQPMPCLFDGERVVGNGVLAIVLPRHRGAILEHGYGVPERMITATSTQGNRILQIDWRPAFDVYRELAQAQYGVAIDRDNFYQYAVHFPFGIVRANGITLVRIPVALEEDGSLFCVGEVPANSVLALLEAPPVDSRHTLETICSGLTAGNGPLAGRELLLFYCAGRRLHLGIDAAAAEIQGLAAQSGVATLAGALSLGEIGSTVEREYPLFHNATLVASLWGRPGP
jgi:hypothetical protein